MGSSRRVVPIVVAIAAAACTAGRDAGGTGIGGGCRPGEPIACTCVDGSDGVGTCGVLGCACEGEPVEPPGVDPGPPDPGPVPAPETPDRLPPDTFAGLFSVPGEVDFGVGKPGCTTGDRELRLVNGGIEPVTLGRIRVEGSDAFYLRSAPEPGTALEPGAFAVVELVYRPTAEGEDLGRLVVEDGRPASLEVPLRGTASRDVTQRDEFRQHLRPKLDILVVLDNGAAMAPVAPRLAAELGPLADMAWIGDADFHLAVTTTGLVAGGPGCPGGVEGGEDGRFFPVDGSRPRILTRDTPDLRATFEANLAVGTCQAAPPAILDATLAAVTAPLSTSADDPRHSEADDGNLGFFRPDAQLVVLAVSDRVDASASAPADVYAAILAQKGAGNSHLFYFGVISGGRGGCSGQDGLAVPGDGRPIELADLTDGGSTASLCGRDWLEALGIHAAHALDSCFYLGNQPEDRNANGVISDLDGELWVRIDGAPVPSSADGERVWEYSKDRIAVCFTPDHVPAPGVSIELEYYVACLSW